MTGPGPCRVRCIVCTETVKETLANPEVPRSHVNAQVVPLSGRFRLEL